MYITNLKIKNVNTFIKYTYYPYVAPLLLAMDCM